MEYKETNEQVLYVNEIFYSIQGESTYQGLPCIFVRLAGCNLRCRWCDTTYAFYEGQKMTFEEIMDRIKKYNTNLVEITGGEPLLQKNVILFMSGLIENGYKVLLETSGSISIKDIPQGVIIIMDVKCPASGESDKNLWENLHYLKPSDQIKFVIADKNDYLWAKDIIKKYDLDKNFIILFSPVFEYNIATELVEWILKDNLNVRLNLQLHKILWGNQRGR